MPCWSGWIAVTKSSRRWRILTSFFQTSIPSCRHLRRRLRRHPNVARPLHLLASSTSLTLGCPERHSDANVHFQFTRGVSFYWCRVAPLPSTLLGASYNFHEFTRVASGSPNASVFGGLELPVNNIQVSHLVAQNAIVMQMYVFKLHEGSHFLGVHVYHSHLLC